MADPQAPPVHICIRQTLDWSDEAFVRAHILPGFRRKYDAWNATFTMPYHMFRHRLKAIAQLSFSRVEGAVCSAIDEVPAGHIVVPVDDDDWFAPDLATRLRQTFEAGATGYLWQRVTLQQEPLLLRLRTRAARFIRRRDRHVCKTNNYALRQSPALAPLIGNHVQASAYVDTHLSFIRRIPAVLGVQNKSLASQTTLAWRRPSIEPRELVALLRSYRALYVSWRHAGAVPWAAPYVASMAALMSEVDVQ